MLLSAASISLDYGYNNTISTRGGKVYTLDNIDFIDDRVLKNVKDVTINNDQVLLLTKNIKLNDFMVDTLSAVDTETYVTNSLITNSDGHYLYTTSVNPWTGTDLAFTTNILSAAVFTFDFTKAVTGSYTASANTVTIRTSFLPPGEPDYVDVYLRNNAASGYLSAGTTTTDPTDTTFFYILSGASFSLFSKAAGVVNKLIYCNNNRLEYTTLAPSAPNTVTFPTTSVFSFTRATDDNYNYILQSFGESSLIKYEAADNIISVEANASKLPFNHLITTAYKTLVYNDVYGHELGTNINLLKNYYSPEHIQTTDLDTQLRSYNKIYTGLNQVDGYDKIYLGYNSSTINRTFTKDVDTYFHFPYGTDIIALTGTSQSLIDYGAAGNITPLRSDRVFKKVAGYKNYSNWGDTVTTPQNGTYFCSWLSASPDKTVLPVWMDRYYDPRRLGNSLTYSTSGALIASNNNNPNIIWDTPSLLTFEPGVVYNYHRVGDKDNLTFVNDIPNLTYYINEWADVLVNQVTGLSAGIINSFTTANSAIDVTVRTPYYIVDSTYGTLTTTNADFTSNDGITLSFFAYEKDWNDIKGQQIVGNYFNGGIGLFNNNPIFTPYFTVCTSNGHVTTFNSDLKVLNTEIANTLNIGTLSGRNFIVRGNYDSNYFLVDAHPSNYYLSVFDADDLLVQKTPLSASATGITSYPIAKTFYYSLTGTEYIITQSRTGLNSCTYRKFLPDGTLVKTDTSSSYNDFYIDNSGDPIYFQGSANYSALTGSGVVTDSKGTSYALSGSQLMRGISTASFSLSSNAILTIENAEHINCDQDDYLWVAYNYKYLAKVNTRGDTVWIKQINTEESIHNVNAMRVVNFIAEVDASGTNYYCLLLDGKSEYIYKIDSNGVIVDKLNVPGLMPAGDCTGFDAQRRFYKPTTISPGLTVKVVTKDTTALSPTPNYVTLNCSTSALGPGWHHFAITYDNTDITKFYIDGEVVAQNPASGTYSSPRVLHSIYNFKNNPNISIGTTNFKTNTLGEWIQMPTSNLFNGNIADVRLYSKTLNWSDIKAISKNYLYNQFVDLNWNSPTGTRGYIEEIERFFLHRLPGAKSQFYNIKIKNSGIVDPNVRAIVENNIRSASTKVTPAYTSLRSIIWE